MSKRGTPRPRTRVGLPAVFVVLGFSSLAPPSAADGDMTFRGAMNLLPTGGLFAILWDERDGLSVGPPRPAFHTPNDACTTVAVVQPVCLGVLTGHHQFLSGRVVLGILGSAAALQALPEPLASTYVWSADGTGYGFSCGLTISGTTLTAACRASGEEVPDTGWYVEGSQAAAGGGALTHFVLQCAGATCDL